MRVERSLFCEESVSTSMPQPGNLIPCSDLEGTDSEEVIPTSPSSRKGKDHATEIGGQTPNEPLIPASELDLKVAMKAMIKGEMMSIWDMLSKFERIHNPLAPSFSEDEIPLPYNKELPEVTIIGDTMAPKIALYEGPTDPYDHLNSFCYAMDGQGANETISSFAELCRAFLDRFMIISSWLYTTNDLSAVRQRMDKSPCDYVTHFNNEYASMPMSSKKPPVNRLNHHITKWDYCRV